SNAHEGNGIKNGGLQGNKSNGGDATQKTKIKVMASKMAVLKVTKIMVDQLLKAMPMKVKASLMADYKAIKVMVEEL
ncbi:hypothetical protein AAGX49_15165, partial [Staphylococcus aureus]